ncbi:MotA/TolQ/ExbB proton channel family protein [Verrucomicrobiota bacterium]
MERLCRPVTMLVAAILASAALNVYAQENKPDIPTMDVPIADIEDVGEEAGAEVIAEQLEGLEEGDHKEFKIHTDDDISALEEGDIYKSNQTAFKIKSVKAKGEKGGTFVVERIRGKMDPSMRWHRMSGEGPISIGSRETLLDRVISGGAVMYPIGFLLLLTIIVSIRLLYYYRTDLHCSREFADECRKAIEEGDFARFEDLAVEEPGLLAHICRIIIANVRRLTIAEINSRVETEAMHEVGRMSFPLRLLNFIAVSAPLLGLLGTVLGMITCFESLAGETATQSKAMAMAGGIKQALLTTAFGLIVALPSLMMFFIFNYRITQISNLCAMTAEEIVHEISIVKRAAQRAIEQEVDESADQAEEGNGS